VPTAIAVAVDSTGSGRMRGALVDLSAYSARIETERPLVAGDRVVLALPGSPGEEGLDLSAVIWEVPPRGTVAVFINVSAADFARLQGLIERRRARPD